MDEGLFKQWYALQRDLEGVAVRYHHEKDDPELKEAYDKKVFYYTYRLWLLASEIRKAILSQIVEEPMLDAFYEIELPNQTPERYEKIRTVLDNFLSSRMQALLPKGISIGYEFAYCEPHLTVRILACRTSIESLDVAKKIFLQVRQLSESMGIEGTKLTSIMLRSTQAVRPVRFGHAAACEGKIAQALTRPMAKRA